MRNLKGVKMRSILLSVLVITNIVMAEDKSIVTVYNNGGVISTTKTFELNNEINQISFDNISDLISENSIIILGNDVYELSYKKNNLTYEKLLQANIGRNVSILNRLDNSLLFKAELLTADREPLLKRHTQELQGKTEVFWKKTDNEKIEFRNGVVGALGKNKVVALVGGSGETEMELLYMDNGLGWSASYVGVIEDGVASLTGMIDISNRSNLNHKKINLKVVAGKVNIQANSRGYDITGYDREGYSRNSYSAGRKIANISPISKAGYFVYNYPRKIDIEPKSTKKLFMFSKDDVAYNEKHKINGTLGRNKRKINPSKIIQMRNTSNNLGHIIPNGAISMFEKSSDGGLLFIGQANVNDTNIGETISVGVGKAFDIVSNFEIYEEDASLMGRISGKHRITITNNKKTQVKINILLDRPRNNISVGSFKYKRKTIVPNIKNRQIEFNVMIPANSTVSGVMEYVRIK